MKSLAIVIIIIFVAACGEREQLQSSASNDPEQSKLPSNSRATSSDGSLIAGRYEVIEDGSIVLM